MQVENGQFLTVTFYWLEVGHCRHDRQPVENMGDKGRIKQDSKHARYKERR